MKVQVGKSENVVSKQCHEFSNKTHRSVGQVAEYDERTKKYIK